MSLILRNQKGSSLTYTEMDNNLTFLESLSTGGSVIEETYTDLVTIKGNNNLTPNAFYHITDRDIWLRAISDSQLANDGIRLMRCPMEAYYTPQTISVYEYLGIYGQTINQGSVPASSGTGIYRAIWGGKLWERDTSGADGGTTAQDIINGGGWTQVATTENVYEDCIFSISYDFDNDVIGEQRDWKGNIIINKQIGSYYTVDITDWNLSTVTKNYNNGIYNNHLVASISENTNKGSIYNNIVSQILRNSNNGDIDNNDCGFQITYNSNGGDEAESGIETGGDISGNITTFGIYGNTNTGDINNNDSESINANSNAGYIINNSNGVDIDWNSNRGSIYQNTCDIENNSNSGRIYNNSGFTVDNNFNNGDISNNISSIQNNSNNGNIVNNSNTGQINNNSNNGVIENNSNSGDIDTNSNRGTIYNNSNNNNIRDNSNSGTIDNNSNTGGIQTNSNNGDITSASGSVDNILFNMNNGYINGTNLSGTIIGTVVNKQ